MDKHASEKRFRFLLECVLVAIVVIIAAYFLHKHTPKILRLLEDGNITGVEKYIRSRGSEGRLVLIFLQIVETVAIVLPSMPIYICAGVVYGKIEGILMCYTTNLVMNLLIFLLAKKLKPDEGQFFQAEKNQKLEEWIHGTKHPERIVFLMCLLPIIPNGMIPYLSAQTNVTAAGFMKALAIGCLPGIVVFVSGGDLLLSEHFKITLPLILLLAVVIFGMFLFKKRITAWMEPKIKAFLG